MFFPWAEQTLPQLLHQPPERPLRLFPARLSPQDELRDIHPPIPRLTVVNPALGLFEPLPKFPLGETCLLPHFP